MIRVFYPQIHTDYADFLVWHSLGLGTARTPRGPLIFMKFHVFRGSGFSLTATQRNGGFWGLLSPQVAGRMSRVNLSCCDHAVARNPASKSVARYSSWRQEPRCARVAAPLLRAALPPHSCFKSGVARNTACCRTPNFFVRLAVTFNFNAQRPNKLLTPKSTHGADSAAYIAVSFRRKTIDSLVWRQSIRIYRKKM
jgi:hypothetical protein